MSDNAFSPTFKHWFSSVLLLASLSFGTAGCTTYYWWKEEFFLYRPSAVERAAERSQFSEKDKARISLIKGESVVVALTESQVISFANSENTESVSVTLSGDKKTVVIKGKNSGNSRVMLGKTQDDPEPEIYNVKVIDP